MGKLFRTLDRTSKKSVYDRDFAYCRCDEFDGYASLTHFLDIESPIYTAYSDGVPVTVVEKGCYWLQFAPKGDNFWITALITSGGEFDHAYFDMTEYNVIDGARSYFRDLYLDVTVKRHGEVFILDEDELKAALSDGKITKEKYDMAQATCRRVVNRYSGENVNDLISLCEKYFTLLLPKLTERRVIKMNLQRAPFEKIKSGKKNVELRLFDQKRREINVGDVIEFSCDDETLLAKVVDLYRADSFKTLFETFSTDGMGFDEEETLSGAISAMREYYTEENERVYGVLGIRVKPI